VGVGAGDGVLVSVGADDKVGVDAGADDGGLTAIVIGDDVLVGGGLAIALGLLVGVRRLVRASTERGVGDCRAAPGLKRTKITNEQNKRVTTHSPATIRVSPSGSRHRVFVFTSTPPLASTHL
jgi:hypothetical protein